MTRAAALSLACLLGFGASPLGAAPVSVTPDGVEPEDGDTLMVTLEGVAERVQLAGIDAPEDVDNAKLQRDLAHTGLDRDALLALGREATAHLRTLVANGSPIVLTYDADARDRYGRLTVEAQDRDGSSLGTAMVRDGYAVALRVKGEPVAGSEGLLGLEQDALAAGRGLWGSHREAAAAWSGLPLPNAPAGELAGRVWKWQGSRYDDGKTSEPPRPELFSLEFRDGGNLAVTLDCNRGGGRYFLAEQGISLQVTHATMAACAPESLDRVFQSDLARVRGYRLQDQTLELILDAGTMRFVP